MMLAVRCGRGRTPFAALCTLCHVLGLQPLAWREMSARDFAATLRRRIGS